MIKDFSIPDLQGLCSIQNTGTKCDPTTPSITSVPSIINNKLTGKVSSPGLGVEVWSRESQTKMGA